jgi:hypothetical protein
MLNAFGNGDNGFPLSKCCVNSRNPPSPFPVDLSDRRFCRGRFSHGSAPSFGSASLDKQQDSQQLEATKPAHPAKYAAIGDHLLSV